MRPMYTKQILKKLSIKDWLPIAQMGFLITNLFMTQSLWMNVFIALFVFWLSSTYPISRLQNKYLHIGSILFTNYALYQGYGWLSLASICLSNNIHPSQRLELWMPLSIIILLQFQIVFFVVTTVLAFAMNELKEPFPKYQYHLKFNSKMNTLLLHMGYSLGVLSLMIGIYISSLPFLQPQKLLFAFLPIISTIFVVMSRQHFNEHLKTGYIFWLWLFTALFASINGFFFPILELHYPVLNKTDFLFLISHLILQLMLFACLIQIFNIQYDSFKTITPKKYLITYNQIIVAYALLSFVLGISICLTSQDILSIHHTALVLSVLGALYTLYFHSFYVIKVLFNQFFHIFFRVKIHGFQQFNTIKKPIIVISNHLSYLDVPLIGSILPIRFIFPVNPEVAHLPIVRIGKRFTQIFPLKPNQPQLLRPFIEMIKNMSNGMIFPEGQRSATGNLLKIYKGTALCAQRTNASLLPVILDGLQYHTTTRKELALPKRVFPKINVTIGAPFKIENTKEGDFEIFQQLFNLQLQMPRPTHFSDALIQAHNKYWKNKPILFYKGEVFSYKTILSNLKNIHLEHNEFLHLDKENSTHPLLVWKALTSNVPVVIGPIDSYQPKKCALSVYHDHQWHHYTMKQLLDVTHIWGIISEITPSDIVFYQEDSSSPVGFCIGYIAPMLLNHKHVIGSEKGQLISEEIYEQRATILIANNTVIEKLMNFSNTYNLSTINRVYGIDARNLKTAWQEQFIKPLFNVENDFTHIMDQIETPRMENGCSICKLIDKTSTEV